MDEQLGEAASSTAETMLIIANKVVFLQVCNKVSFDQAFKYFDNVGCESYWSVVSSFCLAVFFVDWGDDLVLIQFWDVAMV